MRRKQGWEGRLAAALRDGEDRPFEWGAHDCCLFAADVVLAMTGFDPGDWFRGRYSTRRGAAMVLRHYTNGGGVAAMAETVAAGMGWREIAPAFAGRGDVVLLDLTDGPSLGVVDTSGLAAAHVGPSGLGRSPLADGLRAWRVA